MIPITRPYLPPLEEYERLLERIWQTRMLSNFSEFATQLEDLTAKRLGVGTRVVSSGDIGLIIAIAALRIPEGSSVALPSFTFNSTVNAVIWNRLRPVFVDIDPQTYNIDPNDAERVCRESEAKLLIGTHVFGAPCDIEALSAVAETTGTRLLFDAAHAYGSEHLGRPVGGFGDAEVFSLSGTKPVTSGEGGIIASRDEAYLGRVEYLRAYGFRNDYNSIMVGLNGKLSELHAALGLLTLSRIDEALARRTALVGKYRQALASAEVAFQLIAAADRSTFKDLAVRFSDRSRRDEVEVALDKAGIQTKRYFLPCHRMTAFKVFARRSLPMTELTYDHLLCVPLFEELTEDEVNQIAGIVRQS